MPEFIKPNIKVPVSLWGEVKVAAFRRGISAGDLVVEILSENFGGLRAGSTSSDAVKGVAKARTKNVKVTSDVASESKSPAPSPSEFKCSICGKPTKGSFLCGECAEVKS